jgi:hypothetical protein
MFSLRDEIGGDGWLLGIGTALTTLRTSYHHQALQTISAD